MQSSRRAFLRSASIVPATAFAGVAASSAVHAASSPEALTRSAFAACVGEQVTFETGTFAVVRAKLASVDVLPGARGSAREEHCFRLLFETLEGKVLGQGSYRTHHPNFKDLVLFVSPNDSEGHMVEAVFNRP